MKKIVKIFAALVLMAFVATFSACGGGSDTPDPTPTPAATPPAAPGNGGGGQQAQAPEPTPPPRDLGGIEVVIGQWHQNHCTETFDFAGADILTRMAWEERAYLEQKHNFRVIYRRMGNWDTVRDMIPDMLAAGSREIQVWQLAPAWFLGLVGDGAFAPVPDEYLTPELTGGTPWRAGHTELGRRNGNAHGFAQGAVATAGIYFNMRLFEEAGFPREYLFDLQAAGNWTWDNFLRVARAVQQFDAEGNITIWPLTTFHQDFFQSAMPSNNASPVSIDPVTGRFINTTMTREFQETLEFMFQLRDEMLAMHEMDVDGEWDAFRTMFAEGRGAMRAASSYVATEIFENLADEWGFVAFPRGPSAPWDGHMNEVMGDFMAIPHVFNAQEVSDIMYALSLWYRPLPDSEPDDWKIEEFARHRHPRSVDETMALYTRNTEWQRVREWATLPININFGDNFAFRVWTGEHTPAIVTEEAQPVIDDIIARSNTQLFGN
ncbi:MAG: extracellular solute-binding protein [Defluviitaleaceae bacterium]|nr:extracellular solute-binding protein [Defluviitaleaceae bacterium]